MTDIHELDARQLAKEARSGELAVAEIVAGHARRIETVDGDLNAVVVPLLDRALADAAQADKAFRSRKAVGPLHGVPVTVKECFDVAGVPSTVGVDSLIGVSAERDSVLVARLRGAGAMILGKTNLPQLMWFGETDNPVYGRTANPWDLARSPGGSSGGEGAIIAAGGSPLGFGTDSGGSIRTPAHFCGVSCLKPTDRRLSIIGAVDDRLLPGQEGILSQAGPLARSVADLDFVMSALSLEEGANHDPAVPPVAWRRFESVSIGDLRIGKFMGGLVAPSTAVARAVDEAAIALADLGADIVDFLPPMLEHAIWMYDRIFNADGGARLRAVIGDSARDWRIVRILQKMEEDGPLSLHDYFTLLEARKEYRARFLSHLKDNAIDALISPPYPVAAIPHGQSAISELADANIYTAVFNLVGLPAGVVSVTRVRAEEEITKSHVGALRTINDGSAGLPVGVQVAANLWREDIVLAIMAALEDRFCTTPDYPAVPRMPRPSAS